MGVTSGFLSRKEAETAWFGKYPERNMAAEAGKATKSAEAVPASNKDLERLCKVVRMEKLKL